MFNNVLPTNFSFEFINNQFTNNHMNIILLSGVYGYAKQFIRIFKTKKINYIENGTYDEIEMYKYYDLGLVGRIMDDYISCVLHGFATALSGMSILWIVPPEMNFIVISAFGIDIGLRFYDLFTYNNDEFRTKSEFETETRN